MVERLDFSSPNAFHWVVPTTSKYNEETSLTQAPQRCYPPNLHRMNLASLQQFFDGSPAIRLLRSPHAPWILAFLHQQFKCSEQITWPHTALAAELDAALHELRREEGVALQSYTSANGASSPRLTGDAYLTHWASSDARLLKRFIDTSQTEPVYQLTPDAELVLSFVAKATRQDRFIGTQIHLQSILGLLQEVIADASDRDDPQQHHSLRARFDLAADQLEQLKSEFRGVEERFKSITRGVQQRLLQSQDSRGEIIEFALDAEDLLKSGDQGRSFAEFLKLVHDPARQAQLVELVRELTQLDALTGRHEALQALRTMLPSLLAEAEKILRTTQHLSLTLRRLLDTRSSRQHRQLAQLLRDIRLAASQRSERPPPDVGLDIEVELEIQLPCDRPFWSQSEPFVEVDWQLADSDPAQQAEALQQLVALQRIDWQGMRRNITILLQSQPEVSLQELLERFPIQTGTIEVLGYLQIAHEDGHDIDQTQLTTLTADWHGAPPRVLHIPRVVFRRPVRKGVAPPSEPNTELEIRQ